MYVNLYYNFFKLIENSQIFKIEWANIAQLFSSTRLLHDLRQNLK